MPWMCLAFCLGYAESAGATALWWEDEVVWLTVRGIDECMPFHMVPPEIH